MRQLPLQTILAAIAFSGNYNIRIGQYTDYQKTSNIRPEFTNTQRNFFINMSSYIIMLSSHIIITYHHVIYFIYTLVYFYVYIETYVDIQIS